MVSRDEICAFTAGPFRNIHNDNTSANLLFLFIISSALITASIRFLVLGYCFSPLSLLKPDQPTITRLILLATSTVLINASVRSLGYYFNPQPTITRLILFGICTALITVCMLLVLGYCFSPLSLSKPDQPITTRCLRYQQTGALPPLYSESESKSASEALLAEAECRKSQRPSIARFAICTTLSIINIIAIVLLVFSIQSTIFCGVPSSSSERLTLGQYVLYTALMWIFFFGISAAWASSGILCWAMWLRNLWGGPEAAERWPIQHNIPLIILAVVWLGPFIFVFFVLLVLLTLVVLVATKIRKGVWGFLCKKPLKEDKANEAERGIGRDSGNIREENDGGKK